MKIILLKNVVNLGQRGDVKEVSDGYARNYLLPSQAAEIANPEALQKIQVFKKAAKGEQKQKYELLKKIFEEIRGRVFEVREKADKGKLFAGIDSGKITKILKENKIKEIEEKYIILTTPIKEVGEHDIKVKFNDLESQFKLEIKAEK